MTASFLWLGAFVLWSLVLFYYLGYFNNVVIRFRRVVTALTVGHYVTNHATLNPAMGEPEFNAKEAAVPKAPLTPDCVHLA